jgi:phosphoribosylaminoimidazole carboxylase (NCAIR synthetase)
VLYLGWWNEAADSLARHDCDTTFVVGAHDAEAPAKHGFTGRVVVVPDATRVDDVVAGLMRAGIDVAEFDVVSTEYEECIVPAAVVANAYGKAGFPVPAAVALRDKFVQKGLVRDAGLAVARCHTVVDIAELDLAATRAPFVVKPLAGAGTALTYGVRDQASLDRARTAITESGKDGPWLVEEFVDGAELHVDGVVRDGAVTFLAVSRYLQNVIEIRHGALVGSVVVEPGTSPALYARAHALTSAALKAFGHADGVFHLEAFEQSDQLVFSECAGRIGGGMVWETTRAKFAVDLYDEWARAVLGRPSGLEPDRAHDPRPHGWVQLPARPGRVVSAPGLEDLLRQPGVVAAQVSVTPGQIVPDSTAASHFRAARVVMTGETEAALSDDMRRFAGWFAGQVVVEQP